jgi:hypothetical protein
MHLFVKVRGVTLTLDVELGTTIAEVKAMVAGKLSSPSETVPASGIRLMDKSNKAIGEGMEGGAVTVGDCDIQPNITVFGVVVPTKQPDTYIPHIKETLQQDLLALTELKRTFVFIGLASCDNGHRERRDNTILRQQCPEHLPPLCQKYGLSLRILLVDLGFGAIREPQIYDVDKGWTLAGADVGEKEEKEEKKETKEKTPTSVVDLRVRRYVHANGAQLGVYPTNINGEEVNLANLEPKQAADKPPQRTLAGLDLLDVAARVVKKGGVLVAGNFFQDAAPYVVDGDPRILAELGKPYYRGA